MPTLDHAWDSLVTMTLQSVLVCLLAGIGTALLRKSAAASRHLLLALSVSSLVAVPLFALVLPKRQVILTAPAPAQRVAAQTDLSAQEPVPSTAADTPRLPSETPAAPAHVPGMAPLSPLPDAGIPRVEPVSAPVSAAPIREARRTPAPLWQTARCRQAVLVVWLMGVVLALLRLLIGLIGARRVTDRETFVDPLLAQVVTHMQQEMGIARPVAVRRTRAGSALPAPLTWGFFRPTLLLPSAFSEWPQERRRMVLLHELAHIRRADWLVQLLVQTVRALYWFHPLVWWTTRRLQAESERACDDTVLLTGATPSAYAETLLEVLRTMQRSQTSVLSPLSMLSMARPPIESRVRAILTAQHRQRPSRLRTILASAGAAVCAVLLASVQVQAGQTPASPARPSHIPNVAGDSALPRRTVVSPPETAASNRRPMPESAVVSAPILESRNSADENEVMLLRKQLDALELLLVQNQEENAQLHRQIKTLETQNSSAIVEQAVGEVQHNPEDDDSTRGFHLRPIKGTGIRVVPGSIIAISVPQSLQMVLRDLQQQQTALQSSVQAAEEGQRNGLSIDPNAKDFQAKLAACKLQIAAVQKQMELVKAKRKLSQKEVEFGTICLQFAGSGAALQREKERLTAIKTRLQAGAATQSELSNAERLVTDLQAHLEQAKADLARASAH
jgi:beta-lactamase regulating signal transducer with metallopeptidase domain